MIRMCCITAVLRYLSRFYEPLKDFHIKPGTADPGEGWFLSRIDNWPRDSIIGHGNVDTAGCIQALKIRLENLGRYRDHSTQSA